MSRLQRVGICLCLILAIPRIWAEGGDAKLEDLSLEDLLNVKITVASKSETTIQNSPGIVSLITGEEIRNAGARDLIDALQLIPGMTFATDTEGVISLAVRGNWAHEGKVLLLIDGEELNEMSYGSIQLGHEFPVSFISRIEVIRGPGSAIYGGHAELAVINVVTKTAAEMGKFAANATYARMSRTTSMQDGAVGAGHVFENGWNLSYFAAKGRGDRSQMDYTDSLGTTFNMKGNSNVEPSIVNIGANNKKVDLRFIYNQYLNKDRTAYGENAPAAVNMDFTSWLFGAKYHADVSERVKLTPELHIRVQEPWRSTDEVSKSIAALEYKKHAEEVLGRTTAALKINEDLTAYLGAEAVHQSNTDQLEGGVWPNGKKTVFLNRQALFTELGWNNPIANLTVGARFQNQDGTGSSFVPRFAAVKQFGAFHAKILFSMGYRSPDFENLRANPGIRSETTEASEAEIGYKINADSLLTLNLFYTTIRHPIVYDFAAGDAYFNYDTTGTHGAELDYRYTQPWGYANFNYSYYEPHASNVPKYQAPGHANVMLGLPVHKATVNSNFKIWGPDLRLNIGATYLSERYGYDWTGAAWELVRFKPATLADAFLERRNLGLKGLDLGVGAHNLLNQDFRYVEPYDGSHPPQPAQSLEWMARLNYRMEI